MSLKVGDERQRLVPVMTQMLKLSAEEKDQLVAIAQGNNSVLGRMGRVWPSGTHGSVSLSITSQEERDVAPW